MTGPLPCRMVTHRVAGVLLALTLVASGCGDDENAGANPNLRLIGVAVNDDTVYAGFATAFGDGD